MGNDANGRAGRRVKAWTTFELAEEFGLSSHTIARMIDDGEFGPEGKALYWTKAGPHKGSRKVYNRAVQKYFARNA